MRISYDNYVKQMQKGNEKALRYFIQRDGWIIKSMMSKYIPNNPQAQEECMNDVFFSIWNNVNEYCPQKAAFTTWIAGVTRYHIINYLRKLKKWDMQSVLTEFEMKGDSDVQTDLFLHEEKTEFQKLLSGLCEEDQEIFMKLFWDEMSREEISEDMNLKKEVVYNRISRGKKKLRANLLLKEGGYE